MSQAATNCLYGALGVLAGAYGTMTNFTFGNETYQYYETISGRIGRRADLRRHQRRAVPHDQFAADRPGGLEFRYPVRVDSHTIHPGTGGRGAHHGGDGADRRIRFLEPMTAAILGNNRVNRPHGMAGGEPGAPAKTGSNALQAAARTSVTSARSRCSATTCS